MIQELQIQILKVNNKEISYINEDGHYFFNGTELLIASGFTDKSKYS